MGNTRFWIQKGTTISTVVKSNDTKQQRVTDCKSCKKKGERK
jgi:hypothetical protein